MAGHGRNAKTEDETKKIDFEKVPYGEVDEFDYMQEIDAGSKILRMRELKLIIDSAEAERSELARVVEAALVVCGQKGVRAGNLLCVQSNGRTASMISKERLLEKGVDADVIKECTIPGTAYTYVQVKES